MEELENFKITIDEEYSDGEDLGIDMIAFTSNPAIRIKGMAFNSNVKKVSFKDSSKMRIAAPAIVPGEIYRNEEGHEYTVEFTSEEIEKIYKKFMSQLQGKKNIFNLEHGEKNIVPAYVLEAMLIDSENKSKFIKQEYNIDIPVGSMFIVSQITDESYYNDIVEKDQIGYSIEGFLGLKLSEITNKNKQQMEQKELLDKIAELEAKLHKFESEKEEEVEVALEEDHEEEKEVALEEEKEEEMESEEKEEEMESEEEVEEKISLSQEDIEKIIEEKLAEKMDEMSDVISDLKLKLEESNSKEEDKEKVELSAHQIRTQKALAFHKAFGNKW